MMILTWFEAIDEISTDIITMALPFSAKSETGQALLYNLFPKRKKDFRFNP